MSDIPKQVKYSKVIPESAPPKYRYIQVPVKNYPLSTILLDNNSVQVQFELTGGVVVNLAESMLGYCLDVPGQTAGKFSWIVDDCLAPFASVELVDANGTQMANLLHASRWTKISDKIYTRKEDFLSRGPTDIAFPANRDYLANFTVPNTTPPNVYGLTAGARNTGYIGFTAAKYFTISKDDTANGVAKYIKLGHLRGTLFEQDKNLYFGNNTVYLNLMTNPLQNFVFTSSSASAIANAAACTNPVNLRNICLYLAVEENEKIRNSVITKFNKDGINLRTDYLLPFSTTVNTAAPTLNVQIPQQKALLKTLITSAFNGDPKLGGLTDANNVGGAKIVSYQTTMGEKQLQSQIVSCKFSSATELLQGDYRENKQFLKGSVHEGIAEYQLNWFHQDSFAGFDYVENSEDRQNDESGISLDVPRNYQIAMTTTAAVSPITVHTFAVLSKDLHIGPDGINFI